MKNLQLIPNHALFINNTNDRIIGYCNGEYFVKLSDGIFTYSENEMHEIYALEEKDFKFIKAVLK